jgi:dienelactone hydrolase
VGLSHRRVDSYAERFCEAGYACLVFDYRNFGDSEGAPRQLLDIRMQLQDWTVAVAYARTLPGIDPNRIGLWGTSFSGGHVIATTARLPGIAAVVSQCPFTDSVASLGSVDPLISARRGRRLRACPRRPTRVPRAESAEGLADDADATVHRNHRAGDVAAGPAGEEDRDTGHIVGLADAAERKA